MKEKYQYQGISLMNLQKKKIFDALMKSIQEKKGEIMDLLEKKEKNHKQYLEYQKQRYQLRSNQENKEKLQNLQTQLSLIEETQNKILFALQNFFHKEFNKIAHEIPPGIEYNEELRELVRFDFIFGEKDLSDTKEYSRDHYWLEFYHDKQKQSYEKNIQKTKENKKNKDKIILPYGHHLISKENYKQITHEIIIPGMRNELVNYMHILGLEVKNKTLAKNTLEKLFMYILIKVLIDKKLVFETKSLKGTAVEGTLQEILSHFNEKIGENLDIKLITLKKKLQKNINTLDNPLDISYKNALLEDIIHREYYLNTFYFYPHNTNANELRIKIMAEFEHKKGAIAKSFVMLNPMYHLYKALEEKYAKYLAFWQRKQKTNNSVDTELDMIIHQLKKELAYTKRKKEEHTIIEDKLSLDFSQASESLTEIQKKYMKCYNIPLQFHQIFSVVMNKNNNFFQIKSRIIKKANEKNELEFQRYINSSQTQEDFSLFTQLFCTHQMIKEEFAKKWKEKRNQRRIELKNLCENPYKHIKEYEIKERKKINFDKNQLQLNFFD